MTSPPERIEIRCPKCAELYPKWTRASINLDLDVFTAEEIEELVHGVCPRCGHVVALDVLVVDGDEWVVG